MNYEYSCGAVLYTIRNKVRHYVLVMGGNGQFCFPKGHMENEETEEETARREILEETGVQCEFIGEMKRTIRYRVSVNTMKTVTYFVGYYKDQPLAAQNPEEIKEVRCVPLAEAMSLLKHAEMKNILMETDYMLSLMETK